MSVFLILRLNLTLEETHLDAKVVAMGLKMIFPPRAETEGYCMELVLGIAILAVAVWLVAYIQQPDNPFFCKHSSFPGIGVHLHCLGL